MPSPSCASCGADLPAGARFCPACAAPVASPASVEERKVATVLFADLVGSTSLGEQDPERTRALLERFYDAMAEEIELAGGMVEKFAGDAVMAAFGAPAALEDHAERALHAALSMQRRVERPLELRIGVNTGEVVVGRPREGSSFVTGDAVNVAARLEQAAAPGEVLAGERTVAAARGAFEFDEPRTVEAKGKPDGVECRRVVRALTLMRPRGVGGLGSAFVGRESELELLRATYRLVVDRGEPHLVTIVGDAGVGKTRVVRELWQLLGAESPEPMRRTGRCLSYGRGITYWPLGEILKEHYGMLDGAGAETIRERLGARSVLGLALGVDAPPDLHPLAARERLHEAAVELFDELTRERPVVVLIEDIHWAEDELLDLLDRLVTEVSGPLLLISTGRPEVLDKRPTWDPRKRNLSVLGLEPLSEEQTGHLVGELLTAQLPASVRAAMVERTGGNPFFVEEVVATLIDRGVITRSNGGWNVGDLPTGFEIPDSVQAVLAARIDLLPPVEKAALQAAAVIGRVFWASAVCELLDGADPELALLEDRDFVRRRASSSMPGDREFAIKHALTREVAYASLPKARRARLHARFADWIARREAGGEHAALLGHHYAEAVRPEDADLAWAGAEQEHERLRENALHWLQRAADLAIGRYEIDHAIALLSRALELGPDAVTESELWRMIGRANALKFDGEAFWTAMQNSLKTCADPETCADTYSWLAFETAERSGMWQRLPDAALVQGWIDKAVELSRPGSAARVRAAIARCNWSARWVPPISPGEADEVVELADRLGDADLRSYAASARAALAFRNDRFREAYGWQRKRFQLIGEITDPDHVCSLYEVASPLCVACGRIEEGLEMAVRLEEAARKLSPHHRLHGVSVLLELEEARGGWEQIHALVPRTKRAVNENLATPCIRNMRSLLLGAVAATYAGDDEKARRLEQEAEGLGMQGHDDSLRSARLRLALLRDELERAEELLLPPAGFRQGYFFFCATFATHLDALVALGHRHRVEGEAPRYLVEGIYLEPFALRALGRVREDEEALSQALARFEGMGLDWHAAETRKVLEAQA